MTPHNSIDRLSRLEAGDRAWILGQLSAREKAALMDKVCADTPAEDPARRASATEEVTAPPPVGYSTSMQLRAANASAIAGVLRSEPVWVIAAVLSIEHWPWQAEFMQQLPAGLRADVVQLLSQTRRPSAATCESLARLAVTQLDRERSPASASLLRSLLHRLEVVFVSKRLALRS
jgi:flagellar motor switch protein FliG